MPRMDVAVVVVLGSDSDSHGHSREALRSQVVVDSRFVFGIEYLGVAVGVQTVGYCLRCGVVSGR